MKKYRMGESRLERRLVEGRPVGGRLVEGSPVEGRRSLRVRTPPNLRKRRNLKGCWRHSESRPQEELRCKKKLRKD